MFYHYVLNLIYLKILRNRDVIKRFLRSRRRRIHKRGHGIHSPFLFSLITGVIDNKHRYYFYDQIDLMYKEVTKASKSYKMNNSKNLGVPSVKVLQCIFRIINEFQPKRIFFEGEFGDFYYRLFKGVSSEIEILPFDRYREFAEEVCSIGESDNKNSNIVFCNVSEVDNRISLIQSIRENDIVICNGLQWTKHDKNNWSTYLLNSNITASLESKEMGIGFANSKLHKQNFFIKY